MNRLQIEKLLACLGSTVDKTKRRSGWVVAQCAFAPWTHAKGVDQHPSFGVSVENPHKHQVYHCFSCQQTGALTSLVFDVRELHRKDPRPGYDFQAALQVLAADENELGDIDVPDYDEPIPDPDEVIPWPEHFLQSFKSVYAFDTALWYLSTRHINNKTIQALDLRYDTSRNRVCFPVRDFEKRLCGLHGRYAGDHPMPYYAYGYEDRRNSLVWLGEHWINFERPVILVESVFDLASVYRMYRNVMCSLSAGLSSAKIRRIDSGVLFITLYDHGTGGDTARTKLEETAETPLIQGVPPKKWGDPGNMPLYDLQVLLSKVAPDIFDKP